MRYSGFGPDGLGTSNREATEAATEAARLLGVPASVFRSGYISPSRPPLGPGSTLTRPYLLREYVEAERSAPDIAHELGCSPSTVYFYLKAFEITRRKGSSKVDDAPLVAHLRSTYEQGASLVEAASDVPVTVRTVRRRLDESGVQIAPPGRIRTQQKRSWGDVLTPIYLREMYEDKGLTAEEISALTGAHPDTVMTYVRRAGIPSRPRHARTAYPLLTDSNWLEERWYGGVTAREIAQELGCSIGTVLAHVRQARLSRPPLRGGSDRDIEMVARYLAGETLTSIGEDVGMSRQSVARRLRRLGCEIRRVGPQAVRDDARPSA